MLRSLVGSEMCIRDSIEGYQLLSWDWIGLDTMKFSTPEQDNDIDNNRNCAQTYSCGWWFKKCFLLNPNGNDYGIDDNHVVNGGIVWKTWGPNSLKHFSISIKRK